MNISASLWSIYRIAKIGIFKQFITIKKNKNNLNNCTSKRKEKSMALIQVPLLSIALSKDQSKYNGIQYLKLINKKFYPKIPQKNN